MQSEDVGVAELQALGEVPFQESAFCPPNLLLKSTTTPPDQPSTALFVEENHHNLLDNLS